MQREWKQLKNSGGKKIGDISRGILKIEYFRRTKSFNACAAYFVRMSAASVFNILKASISDH
jgi:hypothetical protein